MWSSTEGSFNGHIVLGAFWIAGVIAGFCQLADHAATPGEAVGAPDSWPSASSLTRDSARPTLVMFVHPRCPCSRASLTELNRLLARCAKDVSAHVVFFDPSSVDDDWVVDDLWMNAMAMPGVGVHRDGDGREAERFGALTSGHCVLYDRSGTLRFSGGITASRGHAGDNAGSDAIVAVVGKRVAPTRDTPTFGCPLTNESTR